MRSLWVKKSQLDQTDWNEESGLELDSGEILLRIDKFALTANNITYAVVGDGFGYWNFFPTGDDDWGIVPVWGFATVITSQHDDIAEGERVYGYLPMATHLVVKPDKVSEGGFLDGAAHRKSMASVYNQYHRLGTAIGEHENERAIFEPLFLTSFLIENAMRDAGWHGAEAVVLTSASSKTAMALAAVCKSQSPAIKRIGMTSPPNRDFVEGTGLYDQILTYDELGMAVKDMAVVSVDFAGNSKLLQAIHDHWQDELKYSCLVGATHVEERKGTGELKGPKPILFFAPTAAETLIGEIGPAEFRRRIDAQFSQFVKQMAQHLAIEYIDGDAALEAAYRQMLAGDVAPSRGLVCRLNEG